MLRRLLRFITKLFFREIVIQERARLPERGPVIFVANHPNSLLDPLLLLHLPIKFPLRFVAKSTLFEVPILKWILRGLGSIPVVRRMDAQGEIDYAAFFSACVDALAQGDAVGIFPEGKSVPEAYISPLKTGVARLVLMARERGIEVKILPVGLNYERGWTFRSSVVISVGEPISADLFATHTGEHHKIAVRNLTDAISSSLDQLVFQAETYRERELIILLERLYPGDLPQNSWKERLPRLKQFEDGYAELRACYPREIAHLRHLVERYDHLTASYGMSASAPASRANSLLDWMMATLKSTAALVGLVLNIVPYYLSGLLVRLTGWNRAAMATYKLVYSFILFPLAYVAEALLIARIFGAFGVILFGIVIFPLSYFALRYFEHREYLLMLLESPSAWFARRGSKRAERVLARLRDQIVREAERLAAQLSPKIHK